MTLKTDFMRIEGFIREAEALPRDLSVLGTEFNKEMNDAISNCDEIISRTMKFLWYSKSLSKVSGENWQNLRDASDLEYTGKIEILLEVLYDTREKILSIDSSLGSPTIRIRSNSKCLISIQSVPGDFYIKLIDEINTLYDNGHYVPVCLLVRKLFENLIIEILRKKYGTSDIDLYYDKSKGRFQSFSTLLDNFEAKMDDFKHIESGFDVSIIRRMNKYRNRCNSAAHSISFDITPGEIDNKKDDINYLVKLLVRILNNIPTV